MANLVMENGKVFPGVITGDTDTVIGEVVFNTSMVGYEAVLTDPSYTGQIVVFTYPSIGNYGFEMIKGKKIYPKAIVIQNCWVNEDMFSEIEQLPLIALRGVDTKKVAEIIRDEGSMLGAIINDDQTEGVANCLSDTTICNPVAEITCKSRYSIKPDIKKVAVLDFGIKEGILHQLTKKNLDVEVFPAFSTAQDILASNPDGIFLSNGPGDPRELGAVVDTIKSLIGRVPIMATCLGHQLLSLSLGCEVEKMAYGHRGGNHGVKDLVLNKTYFTTQNHGYVVKSDSVERNSVLEVTHVNVNDGSIEGFSHKEHQIFSIQFHPDGSTQETEYLFEKFMKLLGGLKYVKH